MPNCDFLAAGPDHKTILQFVVKELDCRIYELASEHNQSICRFRSIADFEQHYGITDWSRSAKNGLLLQLHPTKAGGRLVKKRIDFTPKIGGFRYDAEGWGLIQLYLESPRDRKLRASHTNHNSERRALAWEDTYPELGRVADWNWAEVTSVSRRLNRFIRGLAVDKSGSRYILPYAAHLEESGVVLDIARNWRNK